MHQAPFKRASTSGPCSRHEATMRSAVIFPVVAVSLAAVALGYQYPRYEHVFIDPGTYDLLYSSSQGPLNETLYFSRAIYLTTLVVPSQIIDFANTHTYQEDLRVTIIERHHNPNPNKYTVVGRGSFSGEVRFGQEIHVPIHNGTESAPLLCNVYHSGGNGYSYIFNIQFQKSGIYPWYKTRKFSPSATFRVETDIAGYAVGVSYILG